MVKKLRVNKFIFFILITVVTLPLGVFAQTNKNIQVANNPYLVNVQNRGCGSGILPQQFETWVQNITPAGGKNGGQSNSVQSVYNIPVVVHVIHNNETLNNLSATSGGNLNAAQIQDQINILNKDFNGNNADTSLIPAVFKPLLGKFQINFCLAVVNPTGGIMAEPGIDRINSTSKGWTAPPYTITYIDGTIKPNSIWDPNKYMNMWVCSISGGVLGYATFPTPGTSGLSGLTGSFGTLTTDGLVMHNSAFGSIGTAVSGAPYNKGRTATHEIGHWMGLRHIWGDAACATDYCNDTPPAQAGNYNCPVHPFKLGTCAGNTSGEMFMNFMDYTNDACMCMFSKDQKMRAQLIMTNSPMRASLLTSTVCNLPSVVNDIALLYVISPTYSQAITCNNFITPTVAVQNMGSNSITSATYTYNVDGVNTQTYSWSGNIAPNASLTISMPQVSNLTNASHVYNIGVLNPNGSVDPNMTNNYNNQLFSISGSFTLSANAATICPGNSFTLNASGSATTYSWNPGAINASIAVVSPTATTIYTLTGKTGTCVNTYTTNVSLNYLLTSNSFTNVSCQGGSNGAINLTVSGGNQNSSASFITAQQLSGGCAVGQTDSWQSFTANHTGKFSSMDVFLDGFNSGNWYIYQGTGTAGQLLSSGTYNAPTGGWKNIPITSLPQLASGQVYTFRLTTNNTDWQISCSGNVYNGGQDNNGYDRVFKVNMVLNPYSYSWSNGAISEDISGLAAGVYNVTITDANNCSVNSSATITQPASITISSTQTNVTCPVGNNGAVNINVSGGTQVSQTNVADQQQTTTGCSSGYADFWQSFTPGVTGAFKSIDVYLSTNSANTGNWHVYQGSGTGGPVLASGTYNFPVQGGSMWKNIIIPTNPILSSGQQYTFRMDNVQWLTSCASNLYGGGTDNFSTDRSFITYMTPLPYNFLWSNGPTTEDISSLTAGIYSVIVTDANNCIANISATITQPASITIIAKASPTAICVGNTSSLTAVGWLNLDQFSNPGSQTTSWAGTASEQQTFIPSITGLLRKVRIQTATYGSGTNITVNIKSGTPIGGSLLSSVVYFKAANLNSWDEVILPGSGVNLISGNTYYIEIVNGSQVDWIYNPSNSYPYGNASRGGTTYAWDYNFETYMDLNSYVWNPGALNGSFVNVTPTITTNYTVTATGTCTNSQVVTLNVNSSVGGTALSNQSICFGSMPSNITLSSYTGTIIQWQSSNDNATWTDITGATSAILNGGQIGVLTATKYIRASVTNGSCNPAFSNVVIISVNNLPTITITTSSTAICAGGSGTLTANGATTYSWNTGATSSFVVVSPSVTTNYTVSGINVNGCSSTKTVSLLVNPNPTIGIVSSPTAICNGASATLTASGASTYSWNTSATSSLVIVSPSVTTSYTVFGTNANSCSNVATVSIVVNPNPTLSIVSSPTTICNGGSATLTASGAATYSWNTGATSSLVIVSPTATTSYTVSGTNANGCFNFATVSIVVNPNPTLSIVSSPTAICNGGSATLTANGATTYSWNTGATSSLVIVSPSVTTSYTVSGTNVNGCSNVATLSIVVNPNPTLSIVASPTAICTGGSATLTANGASTYSWNTGATNSLVVVSPSVTTNYTVSGTNVNSCSNFATVSIVVNPNPTLSIVSSPTTICNGGSATLTASGAATYSWNTGVINSFVVVSPSVTTTYTVIGTNSNGCASTQTIGLIIKIATKIINQPLYLTKCLNDNVTLSTNALGNNLSYQWYKNNTPIGSANSNILTLNNITISDSGTYKIYINGDCGSVFSNNAVLTINQIPNITSQPIAGTFCEGTNLTMSVGVGSINIAPIGSTNLLTASPSTNAIVSCDCPTGYVVVGYQGNIGQVIDNFNLICRPLNPDGTLGTAIFTTCANGQSNGGNFNGPFEISNNILVGLSVNEFNGQLSQIGGKSQNANYIFANGVNSLTPSNIPFLAGSFTGSIGTVYVPDGHVATGMIFENSYWANSVGLRYLPISNFVTNKFQWKKNGTNLSGQTTPLFPLNNLTSANTGTYEVNVLNSCGNINSNSVALNVNPTPTILITATTNTICEGQSVTLIASGTTSYSWNTGATSATIIETPTITTTYSVTGFTVLNCTNNNSITIYVNPKPTISIISSPTAICNGGSATLTANGANTYSWNTGATNSFVIVSPSVTTTYTVIGTNANGCASTQTISILVNPNPTIGIVSSPTAICSGNSATLTANGASTYSWNTGANSSSIIVSPSVTTSYTVSGTNANSCSNIATLNLVVNPNPTISIVSSPTTICAGASATLTASGASTYSWNTGATNSFVVVSPSVTTSYTVSGTNANSCSNIATLNLVVNPNPTISIVSSPTTICAGASATLTASGASTYSWNTGATSSLVVVSPSVTTTYTVTGTNANGCTSTQTISILVNPNPTIGIVFSPTAICSGNSATLTANGASTYSWNTGATSSLVIVSPSVTTSYTVSGTNANSCSNVSTLNLVVNPNPTVSIVSSPTTICAGASATLIASGASTYSWNTGATNSFVVVSPSVTTSYTVSGTNLNGCSETKTLILNVNQLPVISSVTNGSICNSGSINLLAYSNSGFFNWYNTSVGGTSLGTTSNFIPFSTPVVTTTTTFYVDVTDNGCTSSVRLPVLATVYSNPTITISSSQLSICIGNSATLTANGASTYSWNTGATNSFVVVSPIVTTSYTVSGTNANSCSNIATLNLVVNPNPTVSIVSSPTTICAGASATLTASGASTYSWNTGATSSLVIVSPSVTTSYTVSGTNANSCSNMKTLNLVVNPNPTISIAASSTSICAGASATLTASGASTYSWNTGATSSLVIVSPSVTTSYTVSGTNANSCSNIATLNLVVNPNPTVSIVSSPTTICTGASATLTASGASTYSWNTGATNSFVVVSPSVTTSYTVSGTNANSCSNIATLNLVVNPNPTVSIVSSPTTICAGASATLIASGASTYSWNTGATNSFVVVSPSVTTSYTVSGTNANSCSYIATLNLVVNPNPTVSIVSSPTTICAGASATLIASGASTYSWNTGVTSSIVIVSPNVTTSYTVSGTNLNGCSETKTLILNVNQLPVISSVTNGSICNSGSINLFAYSNSGFFNWYNTSVGGTSLGTTSNFIPFSTPVVTTTTTFYVDVTDNGCTSSVRLPVLATVYSNPTITISSSQLSICIGNSATFTANGASTYSWNTGATNSFVVVSPSVTTSYTVSGTNANSCSNIATLNLVVNPNPTVSIVSSPTTICAGASATLTASGASTYSWNTGATNSFVVVSPSVTTSYTVSGTNANSCSNIATLNLVVNPNPTVSIVSSPTTICTGASATLTASGASTYSWNTGATNSFVVVSPSVTTSYTVTGTNMIGCSNTQTIIITVNSLPTIFAQNINNNQPIPSYVSTNGLVGWWPFNGNANDFSPNALNGSVNGATLTTDRFGNSNNAYSFNGTTDNISVPHNASLNSYPFTISCWIKTEPNFSGGEIIKKYVSASWNGWNLGVGNPTNNNATITPYYLRYLSPCTGIIEGYATCGNPVGMNYTGSVADLNWHFIVFKVDNIKGTLYFDGQPVSQQNWIGSPGGPTSTIQMLIGSSFKGKIDDIGIWNKALTNQEILDLYSASPAPICVGSTATLTANGAFSYTWNPGNLTGSVVSVSPNSTTVYTITGINNNGCSNTSTLALTVNPLPNIIANISSSAVCSGNSATLTASGANSYTWNPGALTNSLTVISPSITTNYNVIGTDVNGCSNSQTVSLIVNPNPTISVVASASAICVGNSATFTAGGATTYSWSTGATTALITESPLASTNYSVIGIDVNGCSNWQTVSLIVNSNPTVNAVVSSSAICIGNTATLSASGANTYSWSTGATTALITESPLASTNYSVIGIDVNGCSNSQTVSLIVNSNPTVNAVVSSSAICIGNTATLSASGANTYSWSTGATTALITESPLASTNYSVIGIDVNGCSNSQTVSLIVNSNPTVNAVVSSSAICIGNTATLSASGANTYSWSTGATTALITESPLASTNYSVIGIDVNGCSNSQTVSLIVNSNPTVNAVVSSSAICIGNTATLSASGANTYSWSTGATTGVITESPLASTNYSVIGIDVNGCSNSQTVSLIVNSNPTVNAVVSSSAICIGNTATLSASGANTYSWSTGATTAVITESPLASTNYSVIGIDVNGCSNSQTISLIVNSNPTVNAVVSSSAICIGNTATLSASGANTYSWSTGATTAVITESPLASTNYSVIGIDVNGCSNSQTVSLIVNSNPTVNAVVSSSAICIGNTATLSASGANTYSWSTGATTALITESPLASTNYSVIGIDVNGCSNSQTVSLIVNSNPTVNAVVSSSAICIGNTATLSASGANTYSWSTGATTAVITESPLASTNYSVIGIDVNGCSNSQTVSLIVNSNPIATISASGSNTICAGDSLILTANSSNGYLWNNNITTQSISVISSGNYFVTVTDINNCSSTSSIVSVTVNNIPGMPLMSSNSPICEGGTLSFTAVTTPGTIYNWSGPNSFFSILQYPMISNVSNLNNGTYSLNVIYLGCTSPTYTIPAVVNSLPIISINANTTNLCVGQSVSLSANGAATYTWNPGLLSGSNVTVSPTANTTFTVSGSDNFGCGNTQTINMVVNALPNVTIISSSTLICRNSSATLTAGGANSYTWFPNLSNGTNLNVNPSATTIYSLVGTDLNGCVNSESITINVASIPSLSVTVSNSTICEGESTILIADGASTFSWNPLGSTSNSVIVSPTSNSTYTIFGANGICKDSTTISIQVNPIPTISIVASNTIICSSSEVSLNAFGALNYTLVPGNIFGNSFTLNPTKSETYSITGTNAQGCNNTQTISVTVNPLPVITIIASSLNICNNKTVTLNVIGANSYSWSPIIDNSSIISISPSVTTTYFVVGTGTNGCLSQEQSVTIKVDFCDIKIYNGITANGDGVNDVFTIDNIQDFPDNHLLIYNRWGQLIYEEHGYDNINKVWPANENIGKLSTSTYYYIFYPDQKSEPLKGWVELIKD